MNPYERKLEALAQARQQHRESEWRLNFLRTTEAQPIKQPTDEEILTWHQQHPTPSIRTWN
jgi:hypothetical protein